MKPVQDNGTSSIMMSADTVVGLLDALKDQQASILQMEARLCAYMLVFKHIITPEIRTQQENSEVRAKRLDMLLNLVNGVYPEIASGISDETIRKSTLNEIRRLCAEISAQEDAPQQLRLTVLPGGKGRQRMEQ